MTYASAVPGSGGECALLQTDLEVYPAVKCEIMPMKPIPTEIDLVVRLSTAAWPACTIRGLFIRAIGATNVLRPRPLTLMTWT